MTEPANPAPPTAEQVKQAARDLHTAGCHPVPVKKGGKTPVLIRNITGKHPAITTEQIEQYGWNSNLAARVPEGHFILDRDEWSVPGAWNNLKATLGDLSVLENAPFNTRRSDGSGHYLLKMPDEWRNEDGTWPKLKGSPCGSKGGWECLQFHHRYAVCWPSINDEDGLQWQCWRNHTMTELLGPLAPADEWPVAPAEWIRHLRAGARTRNPNPTLKTKEDYLDAAAELNQQQVEDKGSEEPPPAPTGWDDEDKSRHDWLVSFAAKMAAKRGATVALLRAQMRGTKAYKSLTDDPNRSQGTAEETQKIAEWAFNNCRKTADADADGDEPGISDYIQHINSKHTVAPDEHNRLWLYQQTTGAYDHLRAEAALTRTIKNYADAHGQEPTRNRIADVLTNLRAGAEVIRFESPHLVACGNGTIDLNEGKLLPHSPRFLLPTYIPVRFDDQAEWPLWDKFLREAIPDPDHRNLLQHFAGACLADRRPPKGALFLEGGYNSGKSVIFNTIINLLGLHNITSISPQQLNTAHLATALRGKKANLVSDMSMEAMKDPAKWKQLTGEDPLLFNPKYKDALMGYVTCPSGYAVNQIPVSYDRTGAVAIRRRIIRTAGTIPHDDQNPNLTAEIAAELPGVLNWAHIGYQRLAAANWKWPITRSEEMAIEATILLENPMKQWLAERVFPTDRAFLLRPHAITAHIDWLIDQRLIDEPEQGDNPRVAQQHRNRISRDLTAELGEPTRRSAGWGWPDLALTAEPALID